MISFYTRFLGTGRHALSVLFTNQFHSLRRRRPNRVHHTYRQGFALPTPAPLHPVADLAEIGKYLASVVIVPLKNKVMRGLLPKGLQLGPHKLTDQGTHPLLLMFGHQWDVRPNFVHLPAMDYLEVIAAVPFVQWIEPAKPRGPLVFMPRLYLDEPLPTVLGWFCGYAKELARLQMGRNSYRAYSFPENDRLIAATFKPSGKPQPPGNFLNFGPIRQVFEQPFIGQTIPGWFVCTRLEFDLAGAKMQPIDAEGEVERDFLPGWPLKKFKVSGIDQVPLGGFRIHTSWTLIPPFDCCSL